MFPIHTVYTLLRKLVEEFPEQNPIDSGTILQTIQRIDYLLVTAKFAHMNGHWKVYDLGIEGREVRR